MIKHCTICFKEFKCASFSGFLSSQKICDRCYLKLSPSPISVKFNGIKLFCLYSYEGYFKELLYQFKGCFDFALKDVFLDRMMIELKLRYHDYIIVPVPSWIDDDKVRGFNHIVEISKSLGLPIYQVLYKEYQYKQSDHQFEKKNEITKCLKINNRHKLKNMKILIIDDVITSGNTLNTAITLLKEQKPRVIKALVLSYSCRFLELFGERKK